MDRMSVGSAVSPSMAVDVDVPERRPADPAPENAEAAVIDAVSRLREAAAKSAATSGVDLEMRYDRDLRQVIVTVRDANGERVLRQIPPEETLRLVKRLETTQQKLLDILG